MKNTVLFIYLLLRCRLWVHLKSSANHIERKIFSFFVSQKFKCLFLTCVWLNYTSCVQNFTTIHSLYLKEQTFKLKLSSNETFLSALVGVSLTVQILPCLSIQQGYVFFCNSPYEGPVKPDSSFFALSVLWKLQTVFFLYIFGTLKCAEAQVSV